MVAHSNRVSIDRLQVAYLGLQSLNWSTEHVQVGEESSWPHENSNDMAWDGNSRFTQGTPVDDTSKAVGSIEVQASSPGGYYRILCVTERFLLLILLGGEILRAAAEITSSQSGDYALRSQKEQLLGKAECLAKVVSLYEDCHRNLFCPMLNMLETPVNGLCSLLIPIALEIWGLLTD